MNDKTEKCIHCNGPMEEVGFTYEHDGEEWEVRASQCTKCFSVYVAPVEDDE
jgi:hypothetical protein